MIKKHLKYSITGREAWNKLRQMAWNVKTFFTYPQEILTYLNQKDPPSMLAYALKQKAYNRVLMLWEQMAEVQNKTGPHRVRLVGTRTSRGMDMDVYAVRLGIDYCERNYIQTATTIILEPYDAPTMRNDSPFLYRSDFPLNKPNTEVGFSVYNGVLENKKNNK